jgi:propanediol dehydratase small subunit
MNATPIDPRYPLSETAVEALQAASGLSLKDISMEAVFRGTIGEDDLRIHASTLEAQAEIAKKAGYDRLATNLLRAAELTRAPKAELLNMYEALRPNRSTYEQLMELASRLEEQYQAPFTAGLLREAAGIYRERGLLKR